MRGHICGTREGIGAAAKVSRVAILEPDKKQAKKSKLPNLFLAQWSACVKDGVVALRHLLGGPLQEAARGAQESSNNSEDSALVTKKSALTQPKASLGKILKRRL